MLVWQFFRDTAWPSGSQKEESGIFYPTNQLLKVNPVVTLLATGLKVTAEITGFLHEADNGVAGF